MVSVIYARNNFDYIVNLYIERTCIYENTNSSDRNVCFVMATNKLLYQIIAKYDVATKMFLLLMLRTASWYCCHFRRSVIMNYTTSRLRLQWYAPDESSDLAVLCFVIFVYITQIPRPVEELYMFPRFSA